MHPKRSFGIPIEAECISPDVFAGKSIDALVSLQIWEGNRRRTLGELFRVEGKTSTEQKDMTIEIFGDVSRVRRIGVRMSAGRIIVKGDAGLHLGEEMTGGTITVDGNTSSWTGSMMTGGTIEIKGSAGDYIGAAYRGSTRGISGGEIIIRGNAGNEIGCFMTGGTIKVGGDVGQFAGIHMRDGTIFVQGNSEGRAGAQMLNGKIVICSCIPSILPTFTIDSIRPKVKVDKEKVEGPFYRFIGDLADDGNGKLFVSQTKNPHLGFYEKYL